MQKPFRNLLLKKSEEEIEEFLKSNVRFYPLDVYKFFDMRGGCYVYDCFRYIRKVENINTKYIPRNVMIKYFQIRSE